VIRVADAFDAMLTHRFYRPALTPEAAIEIIHIGSGTEFDPRCAWALLRIVLRNPPNLPISAGKGLLPRVVEAVQLVA